MSLTGHGFRWQAWCAGTGFGLVLVALTSLHFIRIDLDPLRRHLSEYAVGRTGWIMRLSFLSAALGLAGLIGLFRQSIVRSGYRNVACLALGGAALLNVVMAMFVTDLSVPNEVGRVVTTSVGRVHDLAAAIHAVAWFAAVAALPLAMKRDPRWSPIAMRSALGGCCVAASVASRAVSPSDFVGLTQRLWIGAVLIWALGHTVAALNRLPRPGPATIK